MKAYFLNDCRAYHLGSRAVSYNLKWLAARAGIELIGWQPDAPIEPGQLVIINGEGTFHHAAKRAHDLHSTATQLRKRGCRVVLLNTLAQAIEFDFSIYERIAVREGLSGSFIQARCSRPVTVIPDAAFCVGNPPPPIEPTRSGILFLDSVSTDATRTLDAIAAENGETVLRLCESKMRAVELIALMRTKRLVVSGRFHGVVLAMLAHTPVIGYASNSWKTEGMLRDLGCSGAYAADAAAVRAKIASGIGATIKQTKIASIRRQWIEFFQSLTTPLPMPPFVPVIEHAGSPVARTDSCVLVGNGPSVLTSENGARIDGFTQVVRFNRFKVAGYEKHVGSKTTLWATFGRGTMPADNFIPARALFIHGNASDPAFGGDVWRVPIKFYNALVPRVRARSKRSPAAITKLIPSTGFLVTLWLIEGCDVAQVHLVGFDHFSKAQSKLHHYWVKRGFGQPVEHDGEAEAQIMAELRDAGRVVYL